MRIALLTYRGNMYCGGQGIYAAHIPRELARQGADVHVIAGPPLPELAPGIPLHAIPNENFFGRPLAAALPRDNPFRALWPGHLWELGVSRFGVFPELTAFGMRLLTRWGALQRRHRFERQGEAGLAIRSYTSRRNAYRENPNQSVVLEIEAPPEATLELALTEPVAQRTSVKLADLARGSHHEFTGPFPKEAWQWHRLVPLAASAVSGTISATFSGWKCLSITRSRRDRCAAGTA